MLQIDYVRDSILFLPDVLFYGLPNPRRLKMFEIFKNMTFLYGIKVVFHFEVGCTVLAEVGPFLSKLVATKMPFAVQFVQRRQRSPDFSFKSGVEFAFLS